MGKRKTAISGQLSDLDLRLLRVFKTVVDAGGFTAAEVQLNLANSTICNYIADLEKRLDMRLCDRGRAGFSLTEHGKEVYEATVELLSAVDHFRNRVNVSHDRILGHLHLGCSEHMMNLPQDVIVDALRLFAEKAPDVRLRITTMMAGEVVPAVNDGRVQIGITVLHRSVNNLETLRLHDESMTLYCGKGHPLFDKSADEISITDLSQYKFVESPRLKTGHELLPLMEAWDKHAVAYHQEARAQLILTGHYLGLLPSHLVESWGLQALMRPIFPEKFLYQNTYYALAKPTTLKGLVAATFMSCLKQAMQQIKNS